MVSAARAISASVASRSKVAASKPSNLLHPGQADASHRRDEGDRLLARKIVGRIFLCRLQGPLGANLHVGFSGRFVLAIRIQPGDGAQHPRVVGQRQRYCTPTAEITPKVEGVGAQGMG